jgi:Bromodomain extra-terminal - transcription regulation
MVPLTLTADCRHVLVRPHAYLHCSGSDFYNLAQALNKRWNDKFKKLLDDLRIKDTDLPPSTPTLVGGAMRVSNDEKRSFAKSLYKISKDDLGKVLVECEKKAPTALTKNSAEDEIELNVDKIPPAVFADLQAFVKQQIKAEGKPTKKKSSGGGTGGNKRQKAS